MLGQVRVLIVGALALASCKSDASTEAAPGAARTAARDPLLDVALPTGAARVEGKNFHVDAAALPGCAAGAVCTAVADLTALNDFKVNRDYPYTFVADAAVAKDGTTLDGAATFAPTGVHTGRLIIKFRRASAAPTQVAGTFKLSVCSADVCQIETAALAIAVP